MASSTDSRIISKRRFGVSLDDIMPMAAKKFKPNPIGEPTSGSVEVIDRENPLTEEQIKFVQTHILRQDPFVLGTCHTFQQLRARHRRFLMEEERALLERNRLNSGFHRVSRRVSNV